MGVVAELGRLAIGAWSPGGAGGGYIASGTFAGASDSSFATTPSLELLSVDIQRSKLIPLVDIPTPDKFCSIDWSVPARAQPAGLIAAGLYDGTVRVWNAAALIRSTPGRKDDTTALIFGASSATKKHTAAVKCLAFNPTISARLATGSADGQVLTWDLSNPSGAPLVRPPGSQPATSNAGPKEEVTAVAWNRRVQHILGSASSSGTMKVWDLKQSKQVFAIRNQRGRLPCSSLAWHPEIPTQVIITCENDESTGAVLWDLRNASAPVMTYPHHGGAGVASSHWCPHDSDLLLTSSRDSRTCVLSVSTGEIVAEAPQTANWNYNVKWSPRIPGLYLASAYDGRMTINSLMTTTTSPSVTSETANALAESFGEMAGGFQQEAPKSPRAAEAERVNYNPEKPPKWLKKRASLSFAFGGMRSACTASKDSSEVCIEPYTEEFKGLKGGSSELDAMLLNLSSNDPSPAQAWCEKASITAKTPKEKMAWEALAIMFQTDCRRKLLQKLGFKLPPPDAGDEINMPVYGLAHSAPLAVPVRPAPPVAPEVTDNKLNADVDAMANGTGAMSLDGPAPWEISDPVGDSVNIKDSILDGDDTANGVEENGVSIKANGVPDKAKKGSTFEGRTRKEIDADIKKSVIVGDFKTAVDACLHVGRTADALIIAYAGGPDLWLSTQAHYLSQSSLSSASSIVGAVAGPRHKMDSYICEAAESDKGSWKEALAVVLTYSSAEDISDSCTSLGQRLLMANNPEAALFCFICAGNTRMATTVWMRNRPPPSKSNSAMLVERAKHLAELVQKVRVLTAASALSNGDQDIGTVRALDEVGGSILCEYGALLSAHGEPSEAAIYLSNLDPSFSCVYGLAEDLFAQVSTSGVTMSSNAAPVQSAMPTNTGSYDPFDGSYNSYYSQQYSSPAQTYEPPQPQNIAGAWNPPPQPTALAPPPPAPIVTPAPYNTVGTPTPAQLPPAPISSVSSPRPSSVIGTTASNADRSAYNPSDAYAAAPAYDTSTYQAPAAVPPPAPVIGQMSTTLPSAPLPPVPTGMAGASAIPPPTMPNYGQGAQTAPPMDMYGMQSMAAPPPPPPPSDTGAPPPMSYHAKAKPGQGRSLPPSAEIAVAQTRRSKPPSSSGTPGGPMRRSGSTSSSLSQLGPETILLEKADVSKVPAPQQVIIKSLRGAYMYAQGRNQTPRYKKKMDDVSKRLGRLVAGLNAGLVEKTVVDLLIEIGKSIEKGNYEQAGGIVTTLTKQHWESNSQWIQGLKRLIDCVLTGR